MTASNPIGKPLFSFLRDLARNNRRDWFQANKARWTEEVRDPALAFIAVFSASLEKISPHFEALPKAVGGSLFRIQRDTRFSKDKTPYKTHVGIQFRHEQARDVHTPGFYLHVEPAGSFIGAGLWKPAPPEAKSVRRAIVVDPAGWKRAAHGGAFAKRFRLEGESLARPPRGFDPDHPWIEDLRRKDFVAVLRLTDAAVLAPGFCAEFTRACRTATPFVKFLCGALGLPF